MKHPVSTLRRDVFVYTRIYFRWMIDKSEWEVSLISMTAYVNFKRKRIKRGERRKYEADYCENSCEYVDYVHFGLCCWSFDPPQWQLLEHYSDITGRLWQLWAFAEWFSLWQSQKGYQLDHICNWSCIGGNSYIRLLDGIDQYYDQVKYFLSIRSVDFNIRVYFCRKHCLKEIMWLLTQKYRDVKLRTNQKLQKKETIMNKIKSFIVAVFATTAIAFSAVPVLASSKDGYDFKN